jgi:hypothetical protein
MTIEFVRPDPANASEFEKLESNIALIKDRQVPVVNADLLTPKQVVDSVAASLGKPFTMHHHTCAWQRYKVRPPGNDPKRYSECKSEHCVPDARHRDYGYKPAWVAFLLKKLASDDEYSALVGKPRTSAST